MHSHAVKGSKLQRKRDQRRALINNLATSLIMEESIVTTATKAKTLQPHIEKLITTAKKSTLASRRRLIAKVDTVEAAHKLQDMIAPSFSKRDGGYTRITPVKVRKGDNTTVCRIEFVDEIKEVKKTTKATTTQKDSKKEKEAKKS